MLPYLFPTQPRGVPYRMSQHVSQLSPNVDVPYVLQTPRLPTGTLRSYKYPSGTLLQAFLGLPLVALRPALRMAQTHLYT